MDLTIWQGDKQLFYIKLKAENGTYISLTGYTPQANIRATPGSGTLYSFTCTVETDPSATSTQRVKLYMSSATSATLAAGSYVWDFQLVEAGGDARTYLAGDVEVVAQVS